MNDKTPWNPSRKAIKRVKNPLPVPTSCHICDSDNVTITENAFVYGRPFGEWPWLYLCNNCGAYVGMHKFTNIPLGTLANGLTREARKDAKAFFIPLYEKGYMSRDEAYTWLAGELSIAKAGCHFGWFDIDQCNKAKEVCQKQLLILNRKDRK